MLHVQDNHPVCRVKLCSSNMSTVACNVTLPCGPIQLSITTLQGLSLSSSSGTTSLLPTQVSQNLMQHDNMLQFVLHWPIRLFSDVMNMLLPSALSPCLYFHLTAITSCKPAEKLSLPAQQCKARCAVCSSNRAHDVVCLDLCRRYCPIDDICQLCSRQRCSHP